MFTATVLLCAAGCKKDYPLVKHNNIYLLSSEIVNKNNTTYIQNYTYDDKNRLTEVKVSDFLDYRYTYDHDSNLLTAEAFDNANSLVSVDIYTYSGNTITAKEYDANGNLWGAYSFILNAAKQVISCSINSQKFTYDSNGNISEITSSILKSPEKLTYDRRKNPLSMMGAKNLHLMFVMAEPSSFINNTITDENTALPITYKYNSAGFPLSASSGSYSVTYQYITK